MDAPTGFDHELFKYFFLLINNPLLCAGLRAMT